MLWCCVLKEIKMLITKSMFVLWGKRYVCGFSVTLFLIQCNEFRSLAYRRIKAFILIDGPCDFTNSRVIALLPWQYHQWSACTAACMRLGDTLFIRVTQQTQNVLGTKIVSWEVPWHETGTDVHVRLESLWTRASSEAELRGKLWKMPCTPRSEVARTQSKLPQTPRWRHICRAHSSELADAKKKKKKKKKELADASSSKRDIALRRALRSENNHGRHIEVSFQTEVLKISHFKGPFGMKDFKGYNWWTLRAPMILCADSLHDDAASV